MRYLLLLIITILLFPGLLYGQEEEINTVGYRFLDYSSDLPEDILQKKSVVFVSVPPVSKNSSERGDWKGFATEAHEYFRQIGIDPIAYYYIDDIFAGRDASSKYAQEMIEREVDYIIVLSKVILNIKNKESLRDVIVITPFSGDNEFIANGQKAYKDQNKELEKLMKKIYGITIRKDYVKTNHLIIDKPEFYGGISIIGGQRRNESFPVDLRVDKLAVPKFEEYPVPQNRPGGILNNRVAKEAEEYNSRIERLNFELERQFSDYPGKYELIDYNPNEEELWRKGYLYILLYVNTTGRVIKEMLEYDINDVETDYITMKKKPDGSLTLRTIPVDAPVYKFYVRSLSRDEIYLGETWDADETWQEALENFLKNMVENLSR